MNDKPFLNFDDQEIFFEVTFKNLQLNEQKFQEKEFDNCTFIDCHFSDSQFLSCKFYECKFINCNLSMLDVTRSSFFDTVFEETKAVGINWTKASWPRVRLTSPLKFYQCILNHSSFYGLGLKEIVITQCKAKEVDFRETDCSDADFTYTDFNRSLFSKTILTGANFSEATNYQINVFENQIKKAKFSLPEVINLLSGLDIEIVD